MSDLKSVKNIVRSLNLAFRKFGRVYKVDDWGIWGIYNGDEICWIWPSTRDPGKRHLQKIYSTSFGSYFGSLKKLDKLWEEYINAMSEELKWLSKILFH